MLFLVRVEVVHPPRVEVERLLELVEEEWEAVAALMEKGRIRACGKLARRRGAVAIFEVEDSIALVKALADLPLAEYFSHVEVVSLVAPEAALASARRRNELYKALQGRRFGKSDEASRNAKGEKSGAKAPRLFSAVSGS